ncbi:MAG: efflux RND transporter periplasmic adaptor subunit [Planctomycetota bacterium]
MKAREITALLALALAVAGCPRRPDPPPPPPPPKVTVARPQERELVDFGEASGWLAAPESVEVRARVRGHIEKVHFADGQIVKKGDCLFTLDERPFQAELDRAAEEVRIYEAQRVASQKELARQSELLAKGGASRSQVEKLEADVAALGARIESAKQEVERRRLELEYARITAPISGRTGRAMLTEGNLVNAGGSDPVLTTIVAVDPIHLYFYVDERNLQVYRATRLKSDPESPRKALREFNIPCYFGLEGEEGYPHEGVLDFSDNRIDPETGTIQVRGAAPNPDGRLTPGSRVRVRAPVTPPYKALVVPDDALLTDQDRRYVLVVGEGNVVLRRDVKPGRLLDDGARVVLARDDKGEGITTDDLLIVLGLQRARVNYPVEPLDRDGKPVAR